MFIVKRFEVNKDVEKLSELTPKEIESLSSFGPTQQDLLSSIYGNWLYCSCHIPTTIKHFKDTNYFFLSRINNRGEHLPSCKLLSLLDDTISANKAVATSDGHAFSFSITSKPTTTSQTISGDTSSQFANFHRDKLFTLIASLFTDAEVNILKYGKPQFYNTEKEKIAAAARRYSLGGKSLHQYLYFGFSELKNAASDLQESEHTWIGRNNPQAILIAHIESLIETNDGHLIQVKENWNIKIDKHVNITRLNGTFNPEKGPLLIVLVISKVKNKLGTSFDIKRGFVAPCINGNSFFIIDSELERTFAKICISLLIEHESPVLVQKPLLATVHDNKPIIPDFLFHKTGKTICVEVMGKWSDEEYRARKYGLLAIFEKLFDSIISVGKQTSENKNAFYNECNETIKGILVK